MNAPLADGKLERVRKHLKDYLASSPVFLSLPRDQQIELYSEMLENGLRAMERQQSVRGLEMTRPGEMEPTRIQDMGGIAGNVLDEVDFPQFVKDLVVGVYDSIVEASIKQMDAYVRMYKGLAKPLAALAREISDADALGQVAADDPLRFSMMKDNDTGEDSLFDNSTQMKLDTSSDEVQRMMFTAKLALAKERRLLLRETMIIGVQRLVVREGTIRASLNFKIQSQEQFRAGNQTTDITQEGGQFGGGLFGLFGGGTSKKKTKISVSSKQMQTESRGETTVTGFVEVKFYSDVFNLNNFANLFGDENTKEFVNERQKQLQPPPGQPAAPAPAQPAAVMR